MPFVKNNEGKAMNFSQVLKSPPSRPLFCHFLVFTAKLSFEPVKKDAYL